MVKKFFLFSLIFVVFFSDVFAHSNYLFDIDLDFSPILKQNVISASDGFYESKKVPVRFDFDRGLLVVQFDNDFEKSVLVNPYSFEVQGFRDDSRTVRGGAVFDFEQRKKIALSVFENLSEDYKLELVYDGERVTYEGNFKHFWHRYVKGVFVSNEYLEIEVNGVTGQVIAYKLYLFDSNKDVIVVNPAISSNLAKEIGRLKFNGVIVDEFEPVLVVENKVPVWVFKIKLLYPIYVGVDGLTGEVLWSGNLRTILPQDYSVGKEVRVIENDFIKKLKED